MPFKLVPKPAKHSMWSSDWLHVSLHHFLFQVPVVMYYAFLYDHQFHHSAYVVLAKQADDFCLKGKSVLWEIGDQTKCTCRQINAGGGP